MCFKMRVQSGFHSECSIANVAGEGFLPSVNTHVSLEITWFFETLWAVSAHVGKAAPFYALVFNLLHDKLDKECKINFKSYYHKKAADFITFFT